MVIEVEKIVRLNRAYKSISDVKLLFLKYSRNNNGIVIFLNVFKIQISIYFINYSLYI